MQNAALLIQCAVTVGLLVATWYYAWQTYFLAQSSRDSVKVMEKQADIASWTLRHLQEPVLILRERGAGPKNMLIQNVGEGAAVWPYVYWKDDPRPDPRQKTLLTDDHGNPPHIIPPQQFGEPEQAEASKQAGLRLPAGRQLFEVTAWLGNAADAAFEVGGHRLLRVECQDPRTAEKVRQDWRVRLTPGAGQAPFWEVYPDGPKQRVPIDDQ